MRAQATSLTPALTGQRLEIETEAGLISFYTDAPSGNESNTPLLLIHTVNAAAGAHEIRPLYDHYRKLRPVYALDLPGYGFSERSDRDYLPRLMTDAIHYVCNEIMQRHGTDNLHALAVSLSTEFLSHAAVEKPNRFKSIALVSPTGFTKKNPTNGLPESNKGVPFLLKVFRKPFVGPPIFRLLTVRRSIRFFLRGIWGSKEIDEAMYAYSCLTTRQPNAHCAPLWFLSAFLFSKDINNVYESLSQPVWMSHGVRGDFTNYCWKETISEKTNWKFDVFQTGALPYFEELEKFSELYSHFIENSE